jgi:hypothetical protein
MHYKKGRKTDRPIVALITVIVILTIFIKWFSKDNALLAPGDHTFVDTVNHSGRLKTDSPLPTASLLPDLIVNLNHHKSGTAQLGCFFTEASKALGYSIPHYIDGDTGVQDIVKFYSQAQYNAKKDKEDVAILKIGHALVADCYAAVEFTTRCPGKCPCKPLASGSGLEKLCFNTDTTGCQLAIPAVNIKFAHAIRMPLDIIISAYLYHSQVPPPPEETWLTTMKTFQFGEWLLTLGVNHDAISRMFSFDIPLHDFLVSLEPEEGVVVEFWWRLYQLYAMARQKKMLQSHAGYIPVRFEDMQDSFNATVRAVLNKLGLAKDKNNGNKIDAVLDAVQTCNPQAWTDGKRETSNHISSADANTKANLWQALLKDHTIVKHLCQVTAELGYSDPRLECYAYSGYK